MVLHDRITYFLAVIDPNSFRNLSLCQFYLPQATLKGPKRSIVDVLLVVGVESSSKNLPNRTKIVQGNKKRASVAHYGIELLCLPCMALYSLV